uniref:Ig-like domain-containing protein n=1 Tax=Oryzias latipes TaxID=8090 RepID=A0A3P9L517_ORYLA
MSPFEASLGYSPPLFPSQELDLAVPSVQLHLQRCQSIWHQARAALLRTKESNCQIANRHRVVGPNYQPVFVGQEVTLKCFHGGTVADFFFWYKQPLGQKPQRMSIFLDYKKNGTFADDFKDDLRFELQTNKDRHHLKISNVKISDSATYYCISSYSYAFTFLEAYSLHVRYTPSDIQTSVDQSSSENIHAGDSVTLNCTVHTGSCDEEHRVYWFKDSEDSHPGLIYTHEGRNDQCERKNNTQTHSCVYEEHMKNLTESHAGIYYCAVVSCGHILFGNGTKLDLTGENLLKLNSTLILGVCLAPCRVLPSVCECVCRCESGLKSKQHQSSKVPT